MNNLTVSPTIRPDLDIEGDIHDLIATYPPLTHDRHQFHVTVTDGNVTVAGAIKSRVTYSYLLERLPQIAGVRSVNHSMLFYDDDIRLNLGRLIPLGVFVNMEYGVVKLSGTLPAGMNLEALVQEISHIGGVQRVVAALKIV